MNKLHLKEMTIKADGIPILTVEIIDSDNNEAIRTGYLSPFRFYCFQVSTTEDGVGDAGSSQVIGLRRLMDAQIPAGKNLPGFQTNVDDDGTKFELLKGQIYIALVKFCSGNEVDMYLDFDQTMLLREYINVVMKRLLSSK